MPKENIIENTLVFIVDEQLKTDNKTKYVSSLTPPLSETGGAKGLEPTRYGDWEKNGRCFDF